MLWSSRKTQKNNKAQSQLRFVLYSLPYSTKDIEDKNLARLLERRLTKRVPSNLTKEDKQVIDNSAVTQKVTAELFNKLGLKLTTNNVISREFWMDYCLTNSTPAANQEIVTYFMTYANNFPFSTIALSLLCKSPEMINSWKSEVSFYQIINEGKNIVKVEREELINQEKMSESLLFEENLICCWDIYG